MSVHLLHGLQTLQEWSKDRKLPQLASSWRGFTACNVSQGNTQADNLEDAVAWLEDAVELVLYASQLFSMLPVNIQQGWMAFSQTPGMAKLTALPDWKALHSGGEGCRK